MAANKWFFILCMTVSSVTCAKIKILSDFTNAQDKEFFKSTFPWIIKNIGADIRVDYYFKDGQEGGNRMCALENWKSNYYLQANYLKCEADGGEDCMKKMPVDQRKLDKCNRRVDKKVRDAAKEFKRYATNSETPLLVSGRSLQTVQDPMAVMLNICGMFGRKQPIGCIQPSDPPTAPSGDESTKPNNPNIGPQSPEDSDKPKEDSSKPNPPNNDSNESKDTKSQDSNTQANDQTNNQTDVKYV